MKDDTTVNAELPAGITGATANFVVRPYDFVLSGIANPAGSCRESAGCRCGRRRVPGRRRAVSRDGHGARRRRQHDAELRPRGASRDRTPRRRSSSPRRAVRAPPSARPSGSGRSRAASRRAPTSRGPRSASCERCPGIGDGDYLTGRRRDGFGQRAHRPFHPEPLRRRVELAAVRDGVHGRGLHLSGPIVRLHDGARHHGDGRRR